MNPENSTKSFLDIYNQQAIILKGFVYNDYINNRVKCQNIDKDRELDLLNSIQNIQIVVNACLCENMHEDVLHTLEHYQKHELIELYKVKSVADLKQFRAKILADYNYGN